VSVCATTDNNISSGGTSFEKAGRWDDLQRKELFRKAQRISRHYLYLLLWCRFNAPQRGYMKSSKAIFYNIQL